MAEPVFRTPHSAFNFSAYLRARRIQNEQLPILSMISQVSLLNKLEFEVQELLEQVRQQLATRSPEALAARPGEGRWNVYECMAHINAFFDDYFGPIDLVIHKAKARQWKPGEKVRYTGRGRRAIRRADPDNGKKYRARKRYDFYNRVVGTDSLKSFIINCERLLRTLRAAREVDLNRPKVRKAKSWRAKYTLGNLLEFLVTHAKRHVAQAIAAAE